MTEVFKEGDKVLLHETSTFGDIVELPETTSLCKVEHVTTLGYIVVNGELYRDDGSAYEHPFPLHTRSIRRA